MARKPATVRMNLCWATLPAELKARIANFSVAAHVRAHVVKTPDRPVEYEILEANVEDWNTINAFVNVKFFRETILDTISARTMLHIEMWKGPQLPTQQRTLQGASSGIPCGLQLVRIEPVVLNAINRFSVVDLQTLRVEILCKPPFPIVGNDTPDHKKLDWTQVTCFAADFRRGSREATISTEQRRTRDLQSLIGKAKYKLSVDLEDERYIKAMALGARCSLILTQSRHWRAPTQEVIGRICHAFHRELSAGALQLFRGYRVDGQFGGWQRKDSARKWKEITEKAEAEVDREQGWTRVTNRKNRNKQA